MIARDVTLDTEDGSISVTMTALDGDADATLERLAALLEAAAATPQDRSDAVTVTVQPSGREGARREVFEPHADAPTDAPWLRVTETRNAAGWRQTGSEPIEWLQIERGDAVVVER
jgi:hypothetical protein